MLIRRLIETLIIECFEKHGIESKIKEPSGNYKQLAQLIPSFLAESWHTSRNTKKSLPRLQDMKDMGDLSAHNRRFLAARTDIDRFVQDLRVVIQELIYIAGMGKNISPSS